MFCVLVSSGPFLSWKIKELMYLFNGVLDLDFISELKRRKG